MGLIADELDEVKKLCEHVVPGSKLVSCVPTMVRVEIRRTTYKHFVACIQFPVDYPKSCIIIELKSKVLSTKLLDGLTSICEGEAKKIIGKPQVLPILKFLRNFIDENPLSCCYDEISSIRRNLLTEADELKLRQKNSTINFRVWQDSYYFKAKILVPDEYPLQPEVEVNESADKHVERVYCGHLFHLCCLITYMKTPPFKGGKKCPTCQQQIFTEKWRVGENLAEKRWAHHEARQRELEEVADFLQ